MRWSRKVHATLSAALLMAWATGCASDSPTTGSAATTGSGITSATSGTSGDTGAQVTVTHDVSYASDKEGHLPATLDVYAPEGAADLPLVVLFHGGGLDKTDAQYPRIASELAARGVVVVAPNWGPEDGAPPTTDTAAAAEADMDGAACAVSYIVANAAQWGADPTRIVLFGHSAGANAASVLMFSYTRSVGDGCGVTAQQWQPQTVVLWDGELALLDEGLWSGYGAALPDLFAAITPWTIVAPAIYDGPVHLLVTASFRETACNCNDPATWTATRDPSGLMLQALEAVEATSDGCVDIGEVHMALKWHLQQAAVPTDYAEFVAEDSVHTGLVGDDMALLLDNLELWANATVSNLPG